jgi:dolichyl-phosphate beta-glucosyltransferase
MLLQMSGFVVFVLFFSVVTTCTAACFSFNGRHHELRKAPFALANNQIASFSPVTCNTHGTDWLSAASNSMEASESTNQVLPPPPGLIVLLPAYNEVNRIGETLEYYHSFLSSSKEWKEISQILVVDDGSDDGTAEFVNMWTRMNDTVAVDCISLPENSGKGAAISFGIDHLVECCGNEPCLVLIADADGSGDIACLNNFTKSLANLIATSKPDTTSFWDTSALVNGYRGYRGSSLFRSILRWGFRTTARVLVGDLRVCDSQCGFKLMTLDAARQLYTNLNLIEWSHDVEVLYRAREWNLPITEESVPWQDKAGSKLVESSSGTIQASAVMFMEVLKMRIQYGLGRWKLPSDY